MNRNLNNGKTPIPLTVRSITATPQMWACLDIIQA
jgi:hypothetical protein